MEHRWGFNTAVFGAGDGGGGALEGAGDQGGGSLDVKMKNEMDSFQVRLHKGENVFLPPVVTIQP